MEFGTKMKRRNEAGSPAAAIGMAVFVMFVVSGLLLLLLAFLLYRFELAEGIVRGAVVGIYIISGFCGGFLLGKKQKTKKYLWGFIGGVCYFAILFLFSATMKKGIDFNLTKILTCFILCSASGMTGGMLS